MSGSRRRILFLAEGATMAHFVRPLALAATLDPGRYDVHFRAPQRFAQFLRDLPFSCGDLATMGGERFLANLDKGSPLFPAEVIRQYVVQDRELLRSLRPDLVIGDMRPSLPVSARLQGARCAVLMNAYWSPYARRRSIIPALPLTRVVPPRLLGPVYRLAEPIAQRVHVKPVNTVRKELGLAALAPDLRSMYTEGDYVLYPDIPEWIPTPGRPGSHSYVGICPWEPPSVRPDWWESMVKDERPKVFVSLGSSGPLEAAAALFEALAKLPVAVVIATSGRELASAPPQSYTAGLLPFTPTAAQSSVVVSHGGSGGLYPAIAAGTPVLGIPSNADQQLSTAVLRESGAGLGVRVEEASAKRLFQALESMLFEPSYRAAARKWAGVYAKYDSGALFGAFLDRVLGAG